MPHGEHSTILSTCIKLPFVIKTFVLSIFEWSLKTGFTVFEHNIGNAFLFERVILSTYSICFGRKIRKAIVDLSI